MSADPGHSNGPTAHKENGGGQKPRAFYNFVSGLKRRIGWQLIDIIEALKELSGVLVAIATFLLAWIAWWQWDALEKTDRTLNNSLIAASRGWLAVTGISHNKQETYILGNPINYSILFKNIGKSPVVRLRWNLENGTYPVPTRYLDVENTAFSDVDMCAGVSDKIHGGVVYHEIGQQTYAPGSSLPELPVRSDSMTKGPRVTVTQGMFDGTEALYVRGCVTYSTMTIMGKAGILLLREPGSGR